MNVVIANRIIVIILIAVAIAYLSAPLMFSLASKAWSLDSAFGVTSMHWCERDTHFGSTLDAIS